MHLQWKQKGNLEGSNCRIPNGIRGSEHVKQGGGQVMVKAKSACCEEASDVRMRGKRQCCVRGGAMSGCGDRASPVQPCDAARPIGDILGLQRS